MKKIIFTLLVLSVFSSIQAQWTRTNGPEGAAISSLAYIDGAIYAGTEVNGVYISNDDGVSWIARNVGIETYGISSIISFQGFIFAGTRGGGVYRSSDGGLTWTAPTTGNTLYVTSLVANDPYIFAGAGSLGVYRSSDNGATWEQKLNVLGVGAMCKSRNKIFESSSNYTGYTTDNGETWINVPSLEGAIIFSYYCMGDTIFASGQTKIYRSTDNGNTFTTITLNLGFSIVNISAITSVGSTFYAATSYDGVYKSTDFGSNWIPANGGMGPKDVRALTVTNSSTLIAGTHYVAIYRSTDFGLSWDKSVAGFPAGISILSLLESDGNIYAGTRDGVFLTDDNGDNWLKLAGTNDTTEYCAVWAMCEHSGILYASMQLYFDATIYKSTNKGSTWIRCGMTGLPNGLSFIKGLVSSGNNLVAGTDEGIYYSPDGGDNWYPTNLLGINIPGIAASGNFVYAAVPAGNGVYRSVDSGVNWSVSLQSTVDYVEVAAVDNYAYAGAFFGGARYSWNYGSSWFASGGFPPDASVFALGPVGNKMILAGTDLQPSWIYVSYNNGTSYSPYSEGLFENASVEAFAVNGSYMFAGTDYNGVWRLILPGVPVELISFIAELINNNVKLKWQTATETNNYGFDIERKYSAREWKGIGFIEGHGTTTEKNNYLFNDENLRAGQYQYRIKQIDFDGNFKFSNIIAVELLAPIEFSLSQNYPNPFNPTTTIEYTVPKSGIVILKLYNTLGEEVKTLVNGYKGVGNYNVKFDAVGLNSGIYYYRIDTGDFIQVHKMIILR